MLRKVLLILIIVFGVSACSQESPKKDKSSSIKKEAKTNFKPKAEKFADLGKKIYNLHCMTCHMDKGQGLNPTYPPLAGTDYVNGDVDRLLGIILNGLNGPIEVLGKKYNSAMTPYSFLKDEEIAAVATYVRSSFGNEASAVSAAQVAKARKEVKK